MNAVSRIVRTHKSALSKAPLRALAEETVRVLETEIDHEKESKSLLRGASAPIPSGEDLLRAAGGSAPETAPDELLRPADPRQNERERPNVLKASSIEAETPLQRQAGVGSDSQTDGTTFPTQSNGRSRT